jgi:hypothetical protein
VNGERCDGRPKILSLLTFHCAVSDLGKLKIGYSKIEKEI